MRQMKVRKTVDQNTKKNQHNGADHRMPGKFAFGSAFCQASLRAKDSRDANKEKKSGKDKIRRRQAIPCRVIHEPPGTMATVVVDHDHERDGDAAHNVNRNDALRLGGAKAS